MRDLVGHAAQQRAPGIAKAAAAENDHVDSPIPGHARDRLCRVADPKQVGDSPHPLVGGPGAGLIEQATAAHVDSAQHFIQVFDSSRVALAIT
jgi:hypothetical protein